jgi:hypothetical protein
VQFEERRLAALRVPRDDGRAQRADEPRVLCARVVPGAERRLLLLHVHVARPEAELPRVMCSRVRASASLTAVRYANASAGRSTPSAARPRTTAARPSAPARRALSAS